MAILKRFYLSVFLVTLFMFSFLPVPVHAANPDDGISTTSFVPGTDGVDGSAGDDGWIKHMSPVTAGEGDEVQKALGTGAGILIYITETFGAFALVSGFCTLILATKDDRPESKQKAIIAIVVGALLVSFTALLQALTIIE